MAYPIYVALTVEGTTDTRFLESLLTSVFQEMALNHVDEDVDCIVSVLGRYNKGDGFVEGILEASRDAMTEFGATALAVHTDADSMSYDERRSTNFDKVFEAIRGMNPDDYCKVITPVIPVRMVEAWMLADRDLLRAEIGTTLTNAQLDIDGDPETFSDPKEKIEEAIRRAAAKATHKKPVNNVCIDELYQIIGMKLSLESLERMPSFQRFEQEILASFREIGLRVH